MMPQTNHGSIEFLKFPNPDYPGDNTKLIKKWLRDSWARRKIVALQQAIAAIVVPTASTANPQMDGTAAPGVSTDYARADHVHPHDTSKADAATTYTKTEVDALIPTAGLLVPYGYCTTAAGTVAKTVTVSPAVTELTTGLTIAVKFQYTNTGANPTLNVNELGAKAIKRYGTTAAGTSAAANWNANSVVILVYDGTYWQLADWNNTTYSGMSDAEYQAGMGTNNRLITPARLKAAILLHAPVQSVNGATGDVTVNVPTKTSELANDSGFLTSAPVTSVNGQTGAVSLDATDVGALPDTTVIPTVPTNVSAFNNDAGYLTSVPVTSVNNKTGAVSLNASDVGALPSSTQIPSATSDLTNDSGFITASSIPSASSSTPAMNGTASAGSSTAWARGDHVHPHDTSKQDALGTAQMEAVNSGITASKVSAYDAITTFFDVPEAIPSGADLNDYMTPGHYTANTGSIAGSLVNSPLASINFTLFVFYRTETRMSQLIIPASASLYIRYEGTSGWESWRKISTTAV